PIYHKTNARSFAQGKNAFAVYEGKLKDNSLKFSSVFGVDCDGKVSENSGVISVSGAEKAVIYLSAATDYANEFYNEDKTVTYYYRSGETHEEITNKALERVKNALSLGYDEVLKRHVSDFSSLFNRLSLSLGQKSDLPTDKLLKAYRKDRLKKEEKRYAETLLFQYGRYLLISSSRKNSRLPTNLQGIWNGFKHAPWNSDIHININEQMNYWLSSNANLNECALPLVKYVSRLKEPGRRTAEKIFGAKNGFIANTQNTPFGFTATGWRIETWGWCPAAVAWLLQNCYDYYEYSLDRNTLENTIYPMMRDQVRFYEEVLVEIGGKKLMPIGQSPEIGSLSLSNTYEQSLIWQLYADTIEAAEALGKDSDEVKVWKNTLEKLSPIEIGESGQVKEWYNETTLNSVHDTRRHRHLSNLLGLYPGNLFDTQEKKNAAVVSLTNKEFGRVGTKLNPEGGWTYAQLMNTWARLSSGENAYFCFERMIKNRLYDNLFDYHRFGKNGVFQIDANFGCTAGVCEMLVQSNLGYIDILPALPKEWSDGSFCGITAEGAFEINADWKNMSLIKAEIISHKGGKCRVKMKESMSVTDLEGNAVSVVRDGDIIEFETTAENKYILK
ncbi:MAG: glycosyl hydrolase family 95 catalytic domain-containing protein, partial [Acutalibacteraceae bacterium]